jgi:serine/threonine protein kinase
MGAVYRALDTELRREVALKVLTPDMAKNSSALERFRREAWHVARLQHPNIVAIYEFGESAGTHYLALEFVEGVDLYRRICDVGKLTSKEAFAYVTDVARALDCLHRNGIVHRDIKPANILVTRGANRSIGKLTDLGMARFQDEEDFRVTQSGHTVGTIDYMAPEQAKDSGAADIRSDIYSLACTWFHMLAGRPPFAEGSLGERLYKHFHVPPPDVRQFNQRVPGPMVEILCSMLAKDPNHRYQTPAQLLQDLRKLSKTGRDQPSGSASRIGAIQSKVPVEGPSLAPGGSGQETLSEIRAVTSLLPPPNSEQRRVAEAQYDYAREAARRDNHDYAVNLLLSCCKLDPANINYRRALRQAQRAKFANQPDNVRMAFLATSAMRAKLKSARAKAEFLRMLELGEAVLSRSPWDADAQIIMAEAATGLGLDDLAAWILEQGLRPDRLNVVLSRALARVYERRGLFAQAIAQWELIQAADPNDLEASRKPRDLAASEAIARAKNRNQD